MHETASSHRKGGGGTGASQVRACTLLLLIALLPAISGCYRTKVEKVTDYAPPDPVPPPETVLVYDFSVTPDHVWLNRGLPAKILRRVEDEPQSEEELKVGRKAAETLSAKLVEELRKKGWPAKPAGSEPEGEGVLLIKGAFLKVDEGNRLDRLVIGFGLGDSQVGVGVAVYAGHPEEEDLLETFETVVKSSLRPGVGVTVPVGVATGGVVTATSVGAGLVLTGSLLESVHSLADESARKIARELEKLFAARGWSPPGNVGE